MPNTTEYVKKRNSTIDMLKFISCLVIVIHHSYMLTVPNTVPCVYHGGWIFTDFFFMISGLFMAESIGKTDPSSCQWVGASVRFLLRKFARIYPYFITAFFIEFFVKVILSKLTIGEILGQLTNSIWKILLIDMLGFQDCGYMGITWYLSAMLIALALLYPLIYSNKECFLNFLAPAIVIIAYVYMDMYTGGNGLGEGQVREWLGLCFFGTVRAIGGIALGTVVWSGARYFELANIADHLLKALLTVLEVAGYLYVLAASYHSVVGKKLICI